MKINQLPRGYEIISEVQEINEKRITRYTALYNGMPINLSYFLGPNKLPTIGWYMKPSDAIGEVWGHYYGRVTANLNKDRSEEDEILAWRDKRDMKVYHPECIR